MQQPFMIGRGKKKKPFYLNWRKVWELQDHETKLRFCELIPGWDITGIRGYNKLYAQHPECFSENPVPYFPISAIFKLAQRELQKAKDKKPTIGERISGKSIFLIPIWERTEATIHHHRVWDYGQERWKIVNQLPDELRPLMPVIWQGKPHLVSYLEMRIPSENSLVLKKGYLGSQLGLVRLDCFELDVPMDSLG